MSAKTYRAGTLKEALARVRRDLGGGAVILGTREIRRRRLFGLGTRELIEVTACLRAGRTESAVMPLADTLAVQGVLQSAADQLGVRHAEAAEVP